MVNIDTKLLVIFVELLQRRNATYVAEKMHLTAPAVSHSLNRLREIFNDPLFTRVPHGLVPTPRALELGPHVQRLLDLWENIGENVRRFDPASATGKLTIGYSESFGDTLMSQYLLTLQSQAPNLQLILKHVEMERGGLAELLSGELDLVAVPWAHPHSALQHENILPLQQWVCWRKGHASLQTHCSAEQFRQLKHVVTHLPEVTATTEAQLQIAAQVPNWVAQAALVARTDHVCVLNSFTRAMAEPVFDLQAAPVPDECVKPASIVLHWQAVRQHQPMLQWARNVFGETCRQHAAEHLAWITSVAVLRARAA